MPAFLIDNMSQFKCPSSIIIAGPSQRGKTTFTRQLLQQADSLFERPIRKIVYCYGQWQECFKDMTSQVTFVDGIPEDIPSMFPFNYRPGILVLDDLMRNCSDGERIVDLFTKVSHHCDVTCIYLTRNLFPPGKFSRSISLNAHYIIAFNNPCDTLGFRTLAQQAFAGKVPKVLKMPHRTRLVISLWTYILEHPTFNDYEQKYYRRHILINRRKKPKMPLVARLRSNRQWEPY